MILGPVALIDCIVFCAFLVPELIIQIGLLGVIVVAFKTIPFIFFKLPIEFIRLRHWTSPAARSPFAKSSTWFEFVVVRCVRWAYRNIPTRVLRVFFSKRIALPFVRWRMLRHGYVKRPVHWHECSFGPRHVRTKGLWIQHKPDLPPSFVVYFVHGGGFALGTCYFYLEFLLAWHQLLVEAGHDNPAIFALDYTLVPDGAYPTQLQQTLRGYRHTLDAVGDSSKLCVAGDSAGGTLILSLLLELGIQTGAAQKAENGQPPVQPPTTMKAPRLAILISPWVTLMSDLHWLSADDYPNRRTLWQYASEYAGDSMLHKHPASPGSCKDGKLWRASSPQCGYFVVYGGEEVFSPDIENFIQQQLLEEVNVQAHRFDGMVHAWPVASLFLASDKDERLAGVRSIVSAIRRSSLDIIAEGKVK